MATINLEEVLPVSQDERIKVKVDRISPEAEIEANDETATWTLKLEPGAEQIVKYQYRIEHPHNVVVAGL